MNRRKTTPQDHHLNARLAMAFLSGQLVISAAAKEAGFGADHPALQEAAKELVKTLKRQYDRKVRAKVLSRFRDWKKADVPNLLLLPGDARQATQRKIRQPNV